MVRGDGSPVSSRKAPRFGGPWGTKLWPAVAFVALVLVGLLRIGAGERVASVIPKWLSTAALGLFFANFLAALFRHKPAQKTLVILALVATVILAHLERTEQLLDERERSVTERIAREQADRESRAIAETLARAENCYTEVSTNRWSFNDVVASTVDELSWRTPRVDLCMKLLDSGALPTYARTALLLYTNAVRDFVDRYEDLQEQCDQGRVSAVELESAKSSSTRALKVGEDARTILASVLSDHGRRPPVFDRDAGERTGLEYCVPDSIKLD